MLDIAQRGRPNSKCKHIRYAHDTHTQVFPRLHGLLTAQGELQRISITILGNLCGSSARAKKTFQGLDSMTVLLALCRPGSRLVPRACSGEALAKWCNDDVAAQHNFLSNLGLPILAGIVMQS